jgi:hypothetical protein
MTMRAIICVGFALALAAPAAAQETAAEAPVAADRIAAPEPAAPAAPAAPPAPYVSPIRGQCDAEIERDERWYNDLKQLFTNQLFFDARERAEPSPPARLPSHEAGYTSPMRAQCEAEMRLDRKWMAELRAHYDALLSFEFQDRNAGAFATNKQHVLMGYAAFLALLVGFCVALFLRQRSLVGEIQRLREDVERAAAK